MGWANVHSDSSSRHPQWPSLGTARGWNQLAGRRMQAANTETSCGEEMGKGAGDKRCYPPDQSWGGEGEVP